MSPVRPDAVLNIDEILKAMNMNLKPELKSKMDFQEYLEHELNVPKAAAVKTKKEEKKKITKKPLSRN